MAATLLTRVPNPPARSPVYRQPPKRRPFIRVAYLTQALVVYDASGIDKCRFYRHTTDTLLTLVLGTNRSTDVGFKKLSEPWETVSGVFALPSTRRHPREKEICIEKTAIVWDQFQSSSQSDITTAMNLALNQTGYTQEDGSAIT